MKDIKVYMETFYCWECPDCGFHNEDSEEVCDTTYCESCGVEFNVEEIN